MSELEIMERLKAVERRLDLELINLRKERRYEANLLKATGEAFKRFEVLDKTKDYVVASLDDAGYIKELVNITRIIEKPTGDLTRFGKGYYRIEGSEIVLDEVRKRILEDIE